MRRRLRDISDNVGRLGDPPGRALALLLDDMEGIDEAHNLSELPRTGAEAAEWAWPAPSASTPTDAEITAWAARNPEAVAALMLKSARRAAGDPPPPDPEEPKPAPRRPATRRRTPK